MKKWCQEILDKSISLLKEGKTYEEIGNEIGKSGHSVKNKLNRFGYKMTDYIIIKKNKEQKCLNCGKSIFNYKKFCNRSCAASYNNKQRTLNDETKNKIRESVLKHLGYNIDDWLLKNDINKEIHINCVYCNNKLKKSSKKFCSKKCQNNYNKEVYILEWKNNNENGMRGKDQISKYIKNYLLIKYDYKCSKCGWNEVNKTTGKIPLEVEHIDGNHKNNKEENLTILCPNCHSLTPTYKALNKGNGRTQRYEKKKIN